VLKLLDSYLVNVDDTGRELRAGEGGKHVIKQSVVVRLILFNIIEEFVLCILS
jgi:hypothetical protein